MARRRRNNSRTIQYQLSDKELADLVKMFDAVRINALSQTQIKRVKAWEQFFMAGFTDPYNETIEDDLL